MEEKANTGQVIIVLTEHLTFGTLLIPYMAEKSDDGTYQLIEQAFHASPEAISRMNEAEQQAIDIASHYTEKYLMGIYSREKTVSRFLRKLSEDPERVKNNIRPFIEKKMQEMLTLIRHHNLLCIRNKSEANCYMRIMPIMCILMTWKSVLRFLPMRPISATSCNAIITGSRSH